MSAIIAAVVVVGLLCLVDLLLTFGVIRRLREHTDLLRNRQTSIPWRPVIGLAEGEAPAPFTVVSAAGATVTGPAGLRLAGFFSVGCSVCPGQVAPFAEYARAHHLAKDQVLAILLVPDGGEPPPYLHELAEVAQVTVQRPDAMVAQAFKVAGFPAFCLLDANGAMVSSGFGSAELPAPVLA